VRVRACVCVCGGRGVKWISLAGQSSTQNSRVGEEEEEQTKSQEEGGWVFWPGREGVSKPVERRCGRKTQILALKLQERWKYLVWITLEGNF